MNEIDVLIEALPYIKKFHSKKILIKYGGHAMIDDEAMTSTARDTVLLKYVGMKPLIVHGGGPEISRSMDKLGKEPKFIQGLRVTDEETMEIIEMVLAGKISTEIVNGLIHYKLISDGKIYNIILKDYLIFLKLGMEIYSYQINSISFNIKKNKVDYKIIYAKEKSSKLSLRKY